MLEAQSLALVVDKLAEEKGKGRMETAERGGTRKGERRAFCNHILMLRP